LIKHAVEDMSNDRIVELLSYTYDNVTGAQAVSSAIIDMWGLCSIMQTATDLRTIEETYSLINRKLNVMTTYVKDTINESGSLMLRLIDTTDTEEPLNNIILGSLSNSTHSIGLLLRQLSRLKKHAESVYTAKIEEFAELAWR